MTGPINIIVASEDDLRRIVREEIAAASATTIVVKAVADFGGSITPAGTKASSDQPGRE